ncbi:MAG: hypothetical protein IJB65_04625 [Clostridia bacterium]|nr:hypothetical protein [Clostridia bacterium]
MDLGARKYKYLVAAVVQGLLLYFWFKPFVKTSYTLEGLSEFAGTEEYLCNNGMEAVNIAFVALSVFGTALFLLPVSVKHKKFTRMIDIPAVLAVFVGVGSGLFVFNKLQVAARVSTEYGVPAVCSFTFKALVFFALAALQLFICVVCRIQAKREKLLQ